METRDNKAAKNIDAGDLPARQRDVLNWIRTLSVKNGYPPTLAELAAALGLKNRMTVHQHLGALKRKGFVHWEPGLNRSLRVLGGTIARTDHLAFSQVSKEHAFSPIGIPLAGTIAAGGPIEAIQTDEYIELEKPYVEAGCFALKVKGDSMMEEGIFAGDYVIVKPNPSPKNGDMVVALLGDGAATLKRFYKENGRFRLQPANKDYQPILLDRYEDIKIQGVVVALYRKL